MDDNFFHNLDQLFKSWNRDNCFMFEDRGDRAMLAHRERPYMGIPQTFHGKRGKRKIKSLSVRDILDCVARGFVQAQCECGCGKVHAEKMVDSIGYSIEKMMGVFPKPPKCKECDGDCDECEEDLGQ